MSYKIGNAFRLVLAVLFGAIAVVALFCACYELWAHSFPEQERIGFFIFCQTFSAIVVALILLSLAAVVTETVITSRYDEEIIPSFAAVCIILVIMALVFVYFGYGERIKTHDLSFWYRGFEDYRLSADTIQILSKYLDWMLIAHVAQVGLLVLVYNIFNITEKETRSERVLVRSPHSESSYIGPREQADRDNHIREHLSRHRDRGILPYSSDLVNGRPRSPFSQ